MKILFPISILLLAGLAFFGYNRSTQQEEASEVAELISLSQTTPTGTQEAPTTQADGQVNDGEPDDSGTMLAARDDVAAEIDLPQSEAEWRQILNDIQYRVTREHATERPRTGEYWDNKRDGLYRCVCCELPLFASTHKFRSGTGWPSYWQPVQQDNVETEIDRSAFSVRTEVHCKRCKAHLGHVFADGPEPTGLRYCINSASLVFEEADGDTAEQSGTSESTDSANPNGNR